MNDAAAAALRRSMRIDLALCVTLVVQFLLGMVTNLFVKIPDEHPGAHAREYFSGVVAAIGWALPHGPGWVAAHVMLGLLLVVGAVAGLITTRRSGLRTHTVLSALGAFAIVGAGFNGASFVNYGADLSSLLMAALWAIALTSYVVALFLLARRALKHADARPAPAAVTPR